MSESEHSGSISPNSRIRDYIRSNVFGLVAIFIALGGTAAALPGSNSVRSDDIVNGQVRTADIGSGAVRPADLAAGSVGTAAVGDNALSGADIAESTLGIVPSATSATNAGQLDGIDSTGFLTPNSQAGGALTGPFANLAIGNGVVTPAMHAAIPSVVVYFATWGGTGVGTNCDHNIPSGEEGPLRWVNELGFASGAGYAGGCADPASTRLTAPIKGVYQVNAAIFWPANATGVRSLAISQGSNGSLATTRGPAVTVSGEPTFQSVSALAMLNQGASVEILAYQTSGGTLDPPNFDLRTSASMHWVGPGPSF